MRRRLSAAQRLSLRLTPSASGCHEWCGARNARGYGRITADVPGEPKVMYAHRLAFYLANGYLAAEIRHTCDNPPCCNPAHLLAGTHSDNMRDAAERNRIKPATNGCAPGVALHRCPCPNCTERRRARQRRYAERRRNLGPPPHSVGSVNYYKNYGCRCDACRAACGFNVSPPAHTDGCPPTTTTTKEPRP